MQCVWFSRRPRRYRGCLVSNAYIKNCLKFEEVDMSFNFLSVAGGVRSKSEAKLFRSPAAGENPENLGREERPHLEDERGDSGKNWFCFIFLTILFVCRRWRWRRKTLSTMSPCHCCLLLFWREAPWWRFRWLYFIIWDPTTVFQRFENFVTTKIM